MTLTIIYVSLPKKKEFFASEKKNEHVLINKVIVSIILVAIDKKSVLKNNFSLGVKKGVKSY